MDFFATTPRGLEDLLASEITALGATKVRQAPGGVRFSGPLETGYRVCLWSRLAERVLMRLHRFEADDTDALYRGAGEILWREHMQVETRFAVSASSRHPAFDHTHFAALRVKDAIVDQFRQAVGERPSVDLEAPDLRIHLHAAPDGTDLSIDFSGEPLHRRGYRLRQLEAPLKETLAAGILLRAGWPGVLSSGGALVDPMCGAGTFLIEAAWMALDIAPGSLRERFGFEGWLQHDPALWRALTAEADSKRREGAGKSVSIYGMDADDRAIAASRKNLEQAGVDDRVTLSHCPLASLTAPAPAQGAPGLVVTNPPYGARLTDNDDLETLYQTLGARLKSEFPGWTAAVLAGDDAPSGAIRLSPDRIHRLFNGPISCHLLRYRIHEPGERRDASARARRSEVDASSFANRLRKNMRSLGRWAKRSGVSCYRVYDADVPEFAVAVDLYQSDQLWCHVQEYAPPSSVDPQRASDRLHAALNSLPDVIGAPSERIVFKRRQRQRNKQQYQRLANADDFLVVKEMDCRLLVNLKDRIDTGLYLDHRATRAMIRELSDGKSFLNLYAYTGAATVHAAAGGAQSSLSVDMSSTYIEWAKKNFSLNQLDQSIHQLLRADCSEWIQQATGAEFDLIFLDPPTFSNSKRMQGTLDIQRDHAGLIRKTMRLLRPGGILLFSNHAKRFQMDQQTLDQFTVEDVSRQTIPKDFERRPRIHNCWRITHRTA